MYLQCRPWALRSPPGVLVAVLRRGHCLGSAPQRVSLVRTSSTQRRIGGKNRPGLHSLHDVAFFAVIRCSPAEDAAQKMCSATEREFGGARPIGGRSVAPRKGVVFAGHAFRMPDGYSMPLPQAGAQLTKVKVGPSIPVRRGRYSAGFCHPRRGRFVAVPVLWLQAFGTRRDVPRIRSHATHPRSLYVQFDSTEAFFILFPSHPHLGLCGHPSPCGTVQPQGMPGILASPCPSPSSD